jgi:hypothetical protein
LATQSQDFERASVRQMILGRCEKDSERIVGRSQQATLCLLDWPSGSTSVLPMPFQVPVPVFDSCGPKSKKRKRINESVVLQNNFHKFVKHNFLEMQVSCHRSLNTDVVFSFP